MKAWHRVVLVGVAVALTAAWIGAEALGFGQALPVLVGEVPAGGAAGALMQAAALIAARLAAVFVAPVLVLGATVDAALEGCMDWGDGRGGSPS